MAQIVGQSDGLGQILIQPQTPRHRAGRAHNLQRVRETRPVMIALRRDEDLRLVCQSPERLAMEHTIAITLVLGAQQTRLSGKLTSA